MDLIFWQYVIFNKSIQVGNMLNVSTSQMYILQTRFSLNDYSDPFVS